jgi:hypothetical protein
VERRLRIELLMKQQRLSGYFTKSKLELGCGLIK